MRLLVVGAGSTGGYFGGRLAAAGRDVTFLVRPARAAHLLANGLQVISPLGGFTVTPKLVEADALREPYSAVLLAVKGYSLEAAIEDMAPAIGPDTMIIPVLNGMRHVDILRKRFGENAVLGSVCVIPAMLDREGRIVQLSPVHTLSYGEMNGSSSPRANELDAFMTGAGFDNRLSFTIEREMWEKWTLMASLGGINCLMRGAVGEVVAAPGGPEFASHILDEVVSIVKGVGSAPREEFVSSIRSRLTEPGSSMTSSLYRDLASGAPLEADQILGDLLARAQRANISAPLLAAAYTHASVYQNKLRADKERTVSSTCEESLSWSPSPQ